MRSISWLVSRVPCQLSCTVDLKRIKRILHSTSRVYFLPMFPMDQTPNSADGDGSGGFHVHTTRSPGPSVWCMPVYQQSVSAHTDIAHLAVLSDMDLIFTQETEWQSRPIFEEPNCHSTCNTTAVARPPSGVSGATCYHDLPSVTQLSFRPAIIHHRRCLLRHALTPTWALRMVHQVEPPLK